MTPQRPNILLLMTDQQRGDALGIERHAVLETPYLDALAAHGFHMRRVYAAAPLCIPARRTLLTGTKPATHGVLSNYHAWLKQETLPEALSRAGYQTHLVGKLHLWPWRKLYGFHAADWADRPFKKDLRQQNDDYQDFLVECGFTDPDAGQPHGGSDTGWIGCPFHLPDHMHFTNWCTRRAIKFLERRDRTRPFFLNVSYHQPHGPCTPPAYYFHKYMQQEIPPLPTGDWARRWSEPPLGQRISAERMLLKPETLKAYMAGYYGCIEHIDHQIGLLLRYVPANTLIVFTSDHGDMLGQHQWARKRVAYEGSARIPLLIHFPQEMEIAQQRHLEEIVELMDIAPTLLDAVGAPIPQSVDGRSLMPLLRGEQTEWREYVHGECAHAPTMNGVETGMQYIVSKAHKYIYYPGAGLEQFFDLSEDPLELRECAAAPGYADRVEHYREVLVRELEGRPEGFVQRGRLAVLGARSAACLPGFETDAREPI